MTLQQIYYALIIAEEGSMNRAAGRLFVSQPALTGTIQSLESEIDITIFSRSKRGVSLTAEGEEFLKYARQLYQQYEVLCRSSLRITVFAAMVTETTVTAKELPFPRLLPH